jgi:hypothetical protein
VPELAHTRAFLKQLAEVMPDGYRVTIDDEILWLIGPDGGRSGSSARWLTTVALLQEEAVAESAQSLSQIQQEIAEGTTEPWPAAPGENYKCFPEPRAELVGNELHLWFGEKGAQVLALKPIDLGEMILRGSQRRPSAPWLRPGLSGFCDEPHSVGHARRAAPRWLT